MQQTWQWQCSTFALSNNDEITVWRSFIINRVMLNTITSSDACGADVCTDDCCWIIRSSSLKSSSPTFASPMSLSRPSVLFSSCFWRVRCCFWVISVINAIKNIASGRRHANSDNSPHISHSLSRYHRVVSMGLVQRYQMRKTDLP